MIYLDNNASTFIDPEVALFLQKTLETPWGNPSSIHSFGQHSKALLSKARETIASYFKVSPEEIIFTSGATESLNMILRGGFAKGAQRHLITSTLEHEAIYQTCQVLEKQGVKVTYLKPLEGQGAISTAQVAAAITSETKMIALMAVNNETGIKNPIAEIATLAAKQGIFFLVDGVALLGKETMTLSKGIAACCFSGHKFHAPKGIGFTILRKSSSIEPLITGGPQQWGRRGGTENILGIAGLMRAMELLGRCLPAATHRMQKLRDSFEEELLGALPDLSITLGGERICNTSNISFAEVNGETLLLALDLAGVAASHGSACSSGSLEPSRILLNMGYSYAYARSSLRFSLSRFTTQEEMDRTLEILVHQVTHLRSYKKF